MVGPEILFLIYQCCFFARSGSMKRVLAQLTYKYLSEAASVSRWDGRWLHLACSMDVIVLKFALLEAEFLLLRAVTIVRDTSAINSSRSLMIQSRCISV